MKLRNKKTGEIIDLDYVGNIKAQLTYGDWTCAYKKCVVIINGDNK